MDLGSAMSTRESSMPSTRQRHVKNRHSPKEWEQQKGLIERLYLDEDKSVEETMRYLQDERGFIVGKRKFKTQLKEWGFDKYIKSSVMQLMLAKATKRRFEEDKDTRFRYKGRDILPERMSHFAKRNHVTNGKRSSPTTSTPSFISYRTMSSNLSSLSDKLHRVASVNGSSSSIASIVSATRHNSLALRRSLSNLSSRNFSTFKRHEIPRRNSHHSDDHRSDYRPMPLADLNYISVSFSCSREMRDFETKIELSEFEAKNMSEKVIHGCQSCQVQVASTVREPFNKLRSHCINFDYDKAWEAAEELLRIILPLCETCHVISYKYILSVLYDVALYFWMSEICNKAISILEKNLQIIVEEELYECSYIMFNCILYLTEIYADQGLLHEVELKLLQSGAENQGAETLGWICNRLLLSQIIKRQQRPQDALREYASLSTALIGYYGLHSSMMHTVAFNCARACYELSDYRTSADLYRRLLAEKTPSDYVFDNRVIIALVGLSDTYRSLGWIQGSKKCAYQASEILQSQRSAPADQPTFGLSALHITCFLNLAISFDNEGNSAEAQSYFSRVIEGYEYLKNKRASYAAVPIVLVLQKHHHDRPCRIDTLDSRSTDNYLLQLADAVSGRPAALYSFLGAIIWQAQILSRSRQLQRADYLFNQAKGLLDHSNLRLQCFFTVQMAQHNRRKGEWKSALRDLEKAAMLSEETYGPNHACTVSYREQIAAFREEIEEGGLSINTIAASLSLVSLSSRGTRNTGSDEPDELEFLEDGNFWDDQPPALLLRYA